MSRVWLIAFVWLLCLGLPGLAQEEPEEEVLLAIGPPIELPERTWWLPRFHPEEMEDPDEDRPYGPEEPPSEDEPLPKVSPEEWDEIFERYDFETGQPEEPDTRFHLSIDAVGAVNPGQGGLFAHGFVRHTLNRDDENPFLDNLYVQAGAVLEPTPAWFQTGLVLEAVPLAPIKLRFRYDFYGFFGNDLALVSFPNSSVEFGDKDIERLKDATSGNLGESTTGHRLMAQPTVRLKLGPFVFSNVTTCAWYFLDGDGPYVWEREFDTILREGYDFVVNNATSLLFEALDWGGETGVWIGPRYSTTQSVRGGVRRQRVGGVLIAIASRQVGALHRPRLMVWAGMNIEDRNRENEGFCVIAIGFGLGD